MAGEPSGCEDDWDSLGLSDIDDDYDYEQHMLTEEKAEEIARLAGGSLQIFSIVPANLKELEKDPLFTGELEHNLDKMSPEERALCLKLKDSESLSSDSATDVEDLIETIVSPNKSVAQRARRQSMAESDGASSLEGQYSSPSLGDANPNDGNMLNAAIAEYIDEGLDAALQEMDPDEDDLTDLEDNELHLDDVKMVNECVKVYNVAASRVPVKPKVLTPEENRRFIEEAVARQLREESETEPEELDEEDLAANQHSHEGEVFHFDKTLLVNMATAETAKNKQRPIVRITSAKQVDLSELMF